jgi:hypothetical protein
MLRRSRQLHKIGPGSFERILQVVDGMYTKENTTTVTTTFPLQLSIKMHQNNQRQALGQLRKILPGERLELLTVKCGISDDE